MSEAVAAAQRRAVEAIRRHGARHVEFEEPPLSYPSPRSAASPAQAPRAG